MIPSNIFNKNFFIFVSAAFLLFGCGGDYGPEHYFKSYVSDPIPASVENIKSSYSGFPDGFVTLKFEINENDFMLLNVMGKLKEYDLKLYRSFAENFGFSGADQWESYDKFFGYANDGGDGVKQHVYALVWNSKNQKAFFYFR